MVDVTPRKSLIKLIALTVLLLVSLASQFSFDASFYQPETVSSSSSSASRNYRIIQSKKKATSTTTAATAKQLKYSHKQKSIIAKFNKVTNHNNSLFVQRTDFSLLSYNEATTPIVNEEYKLVLFANPKIGSTVLKQLMRRMMGYEDYDANTWGKEKYPHKCGMVNVTNENGEVTGSYCRYNGLNYTSQFSIQQVNEMMTSDEWTRATFVRDPKERVLSAFLMLRPRLDITPKMIKRAKRGLYTKRVDYGPPPQLRNCCAKMAPTGDFNWELLCVNHVQTFEGFLDMIDRVPTGDDTITSADYNSRRLLGANKEEFSPARLRVSEPCKDIHWQPLNDWRMELKLFSRLNFIGHLETAQHDIHRLLDRLHHDAWEKFGTSGWGEYRNESMFESSSTVNHARNTGVHLKEHYTRDDIEQRVERMYNADYDNKYLDLERLKIGEAESFYESRAWE
ncbi:predicted protein [Thalassiosira pseudonana CCMP1335]|uniref:Sulfotransferase domain-containing protein n=1 Tax=Thalassiosira pseudonana TaxID=35128 RepID=B8CF23_THAPS|nr:predicted protein [Thalassiosira pseudonana CCMP1335]EED88134.1 predicted protein [Thalassiosira pseudonana CCMP1335]|eukprot:scaffold944_cov115-Alexandrium_tamarense.AAC.33